jgi:hypothetical protein
MSVEKTVRVFSSFKEADEADTQAYANLTPEQRLRITLELRDRHHPDAAAQRFARVCRVIKLERS